MVKIFENEQLVAEEIVKEMLEGLTVSHPVFCLASGSTPAKGYELFSQSVKEKSVLKNLKIVSKLTSVSKLTLVRKLTIVSLDEWIDIDKTNPGSCYQMLNRDLFQKINLADEQIIFYDGTTSDLEAECGRIDHFIEKHPITFSLMGVGMNGHIGLNEPGFPVLDHSSVVELSDITKEVAQKYFDKETPLKQGITLGLKQIINSKRVIVVITGEHKAKIVKEIFMNIDAKLPAQELLGYEHIDFYLDEAAAKYLDKELGRLE